MSGGGKGKRRRGDDHVNHEAWAIPYGDLVTLLLAFFVVMYSVSSLNTGKYRVMSEALMAAFRGEPQRDMPITVEVREGIPTTDLVTMPASESQAGAPPSPGRTTQGRSADPSPDLSTIASRMARALAGLVMVDKVIIRQHKDWVEVEIQNDVLFPSGSASLSSEAQQLMTDVGKALADIKNPVFIEGHTDNVPISTLQFPSNWELSAARASAVLKILAAQGVAPQQMTVLGYGEQRPLQPNDTVEGRSANRRVILAILEPDRLRRGLYSLAPPAAPRPTAGDRVPATIGAPAGAPE
jgi:chemotaxis protein MotB